MHESVEADIRLIWAPAHLSVGFFATAPAVKFLFARAGTIPLFGEKLINSIKFSTTTPAGPSR